MKEEKVKEIMREVTAEWVKQYGIENLDPIKIKATEQVLKDSPHDDGIMPVKVMDSGKTHLVPIKDIILYGVQGSQLKKYPSPQGPPQDEVDKNGQN